LNSFFIKIIGSLDDTPNFKVHRRIFELLWMIGTDTLNYIPKLANITLLRRRNKKL
jgi:hypothetical protein